MKPVMAILGNHYALEGRSIAVTATDGGAADTLFGDGGEGYTVFDVARAARLLREDHLAEPFLMRPQVNPMECRIRVAGPVEGKARNSRASPWESCS